MTRGLRKGETWDDYIQKEVFVTTDGGETGFSGILLSWNEESLTVRNEDTNEPVSCKHGTVYGEWWLDSW
tara:strand:- start:269 stop:478 length:210 start_codon:yes stop_codon:yes gene_type:complete